MHLSTHTLLTPALFIFMALTTLTAGGKAPGPISDITIVIAHRAITSRRSFNDTRAALESAIPPLNPAWKQALDAGRPADALTALKALPALNNFILPARDFGQLLQIYGIKGKNAIQYEIGNPYTASKFARYNLGAGRHAPIRVELLEDDHGVVKFVFDKPTSTFGQFKDPRIDVTAVALEEELTQLFLFVGGWPSKWPLPSLP